MHGECGYRGAGVQAHMLGGCAGRGTCVRQGAGAKGQLLGEVDQGLCAHPCPSRTPLHTILPGPGLRSPLSGLGFTASQ